MVIQNVLKLRSDAFAHQNQAVSHLITTIPDHWLLADALTSSQWSLHSHGICTSQKLQEFQVKSVEKREKLAAPAAIMQPKTKSMVLQVKSFNTVFLF